MLLKNKIAIITGAGKGIGKETALDFAREGADLVLAGRTLEDLEKISKQLDKYDIKTLCITVDIASEIEVKKMVDDTLNTFGRIDILVANAGIHLRKTIINTSVAAWDEMMEINLRGTFLCCREAIKVMMDQDYGKIVIISSESGKKGSASQGAYCATKFGQIGFTEVLTDEVKDYNINVNAVLPSATNTPLIRKSYPEVNHEALTKPESIAKVITFMASENASAIKGASVAVWNAQNYMPNLFNT
ncbi:MAG: SDR family NAD(P)-dependent oxidoreductase [Candidatus Humimicrobiaceae bacterium]